MEETKYIINGCKKKDAPNPTNYKFKACAASKKIIIPKQANIKAGFPKVYHQRYGNCTSNAALAVDAYYYHRDSETWIPSTTFTYYNQKIMDGDNPKNMQDDGSFVETALDAVRKKGACNSKVWSNDEPFNKKPSKEAYTNGLKGHELTTYYAVKNITQVKKAISQGYPVVGAFTWTSYKVDKDFILPEPTKEEVNKCPDGHAIVIVGYDDKTKLFEFRNSWGENWGNKGYAYMTYTTFKRCVDWWDTYAVVK